MKTQVDAVVRLLDFSPNQITQFRCLINAHILAGWEIPLTIIPGISPAFMTIGRFADINDDEEFRLMDSNNVESLLKSGDGWRKVGPAYLRDWSGDDFVGRRYQLIVRKKI